MLEGGGGANRPGYENDYSPASNSGAENKWSCTFPLLYVFMACEAVSSEIIPRIIGESTIFTNRQTIVCGWRWIVYNSMGQTLATEKAMMLIKPLTPSTCGSYSLKERP
jgi:hypothetical protein